MYLSTIVFKLGLTVGLPCFISARPLPGDTATGTPSVEFTEQNHLRALDAMRRSGHDGQISHEPNLPSSSDSDPDQSSSGYCTELFKDSEFPFPDNTQWDLDHTDDEPVHNGVGGWEGYNYFKDDCPDTAPNPGENCDVDPLGGSKTGSICGYAGESDDNDMGSEFSAIDGAGEECYPVSVFCESEDEYVHAPVELSNTEVRETLPDVEGMNHSIETQIVHHRESDTESNYPTSPKHI
ncbi:hypothetical protein BJ085DRAFT_28219 [Dimargaris cristalligena]|uniref:Uncharacterized protein n=1 Tax=Dimargaris cristalligena TaxID=215637 RepID=A0A4Q0A183_9FUNG|nr:hypothetical protein BJ085DRAFT_28219 [Dimargaris cristalligena]|eukprot:RKP39866.1 hypothetical protein BJ085DRAFT_28219 [Dimargaris cristalligena]